ncbi:MAG: hypothetical protein ACE5IP_07305 [Terriglobia bacterium]
MRNRMFALVVVALLAVSVAWAGGEKGKKDSASQAAKLQAKLGLSDAQTAQVRALIEETHSRWAELKASGQDKAAMSEAKKKLKEEHNTRLKAILTEEQFARYQEMRAEYDRKKHSKK